MENEIYGIYDGLMMVDQEGVTYPVNENYASKSKLVQGDSLILRIDSETGQYFYKQTRLVERKRMKAKIDIGIMDDFVAVTADGKQYRLLESTISFHKLECGDEVALVMPKHGDSIYAALENKIPR